MKKVRKIARLLTLFVIGKEKRKEARLKTEAFLHRLFKTEYYRCEQIYESTLKENRKRDYGKYHLISLGYNCFGRMTFNYWGLKPRKADGEKTMPFDISIHPLKTVISCLENDFKDYFDNLEFDSEVNCWKNLKDNITFIHDHENDKSVFVERYHDRIDAFHEALHDDVPCLFFAYNDKEVPAEDVNALYMTLSKICSHKPFVLVYMSFNAPLPAGVNDKIVLHQADYPKGYVHMDKFTKYTQAGLSFEKEIADFMGQQIDYLLKKPLK